MKHGKCKYCGKKLTGKDYYQMCRKCHKPYIDGIKRGLEYLGYVKSYIDYILEMRRKK